MAYTAFKDYVNSMPPVTTVNGNELMAGVDVAGNRSSFRANALNDYISKSLITQEKFTLTAAQILTAFTTPVDLKPAPGAGKIYVPINIVYQKKFVSAAYTTNLDVLLFFQSVYQQQLMGFLNFTATKLNAIIPAKTEVTSTLAGIDMPIRFKVLNGNPVAGNGTVEFYIAYYTLTL